MFDIREMKPEDKAIIMPMVITFYHSPVVEHDVDTAVLERTFDAATDTAMPYILSLIHIFKEHGGTDAAAASSTDTAQAYIDTASAGSGMYIMTSYTPDSEIVLEKNPNYWGESTNVDKYVIKIQPDANTQMMTLSSGDLDIAMNMTCLLYTS